MKKELNLDLNNVDKIEDMMKLCPKRNEIISCIMEKFYDDYKYEEITEHFSKFHVSFVMFSDFSLLLYL